jgi:mRNA interferase RelE/StbE
MVVRFRKQALKSLQKSDGEISAEIREKLDQIDDFFSAQSILPFSEFDLKKMKGEWAGFYRLRIGSMRIIFKVDEKSQTVDVYKIGSRGDVYK